MSFQIQTNVTIMSRTTCSSTFIFHPFECNFQRRQLVLADKRTVVRCFNQITCRTTFEDKTIKYELIMLDRLIGFLFAPEALEQCAQSSTATLEKKEQTNETNMQHM